jgi:hypothetical protein
MASAVTTIISWSSEALSVSIAAVYVSAVSPQPPASRQLWSHLLYGASAAPGGTTASGA